MSNNLVQDLQADQAEIDLLADSLNESTGLSWLWAFLFGPLYFWVHGFVGRGFILLALNFIIIGVFVAPFMAYPAWRSRALEKARKMQLVNKASRR